MDWRNLVFKGISELREPQKLALKTGILEGKNIVVSSPTGSGKTLIAEIAMIKNLLEDKGKAVYVVPLRSLAMEKYNYFLKKYGSKFKIAISIGDLDSSDPWLERYDIIVLTTEKLDSLVRHSAHWIKEIGCLVIDEIHLIDDPSRGPTLEVLITMLRKLTKAQIIALSATIRNADEIASWLKADLVVSDYRPVELREGVFFDGDFYFKKLSYSSKSTIEREDFNIVEDTLMRDKQILIFLASRRNAESLAKNLGDLVKGYLTKEEKKKLSDYASRALNVLEIPTKQCKLLAECMRNGVAFHHAGLLNEQRSLVERAFRERVLKVVCCTPTLALGINLPSFRVLVRDLKRYSNGANWISVMEWKQYTGRAGRPGLEEYGEGLAIARTKQELEEIFERYIEAEPEEIYSKISSEPMLRMHLLALISNRFVRKQADAIDFIKETFFGHQFSDFDLIEERVAKIISQLIDFGFVKVVGQKVAPTRIGKRVSELYIDPLTAYRLLEALKNQKPHPIFYLQAICTSAEMEPLPSVRKDYEWLNEEFIKYEEFLDVPPVYSYEYETYIKAFKLALMLYDWINEKSEDYILEKYKERPGILYARITNAEWLLYAMEELGKLLGAETKEVRKLRFRVKYGVKEELLPLVRLRYIGRVKARRLYNFGIRRPADIKKANIETLSSLIGKKTAEKVKMELEKL